jgi:AraC-like DNA-binding protein
MDVEHPGLEVGKCFDFSHWFYAYDLLNSHSALELINLGNFFNNRLLTNYYTNQLIWDNNIPTIICQVKEFHEAAREFLLAATMIYVNAIYGLTNAADCIIKLSLPVPYTPSIEHYLSDYPINAITYNAPYAAIQLTPEALLKPLDKIRLQAQLKSIPHRNITHTSCPLPIQDIDDQLFKLINSMLLQEAPSLQTIADASGMHLRTLQRRLKDYGCTFSSIFDRVRYQKAEELLSDREIKITDIAFELGYNDGAHFSRAFKRWSGLSPKQYRQKTSSF